MTTHSPKVRQRAPQKRAKETRQRLIEAAISMFTTAGFEGVTAAAIEEVAGVQRGLLAYHFGSKDTLWRSAVDQAFGRFEEATRTRFIAELPTRGDDLLGAMIAAYVRTIAEQPEALNFIMREARIESDRRDYIAEKHVSRLAEYISVVSGRTANAYDFYALIGAMSFPFVSPAGARRIWSIDPFSEAFVEQHIQTVSEIFKRSWSTMKEASIEA